MPAEDEIYRQEVERMNAASDDDIIVDIRKYSEQHVSKAPNLEPRKAILQVRLKKSINELTETIGESNRVTKIFNSRLFWLTVFMAAVAVLQLLAAKPFREKCTIKTETQEEFVYSECYREIDLGVFYKKWMISPIHIPK